MSNFDESKIKRDGDGKFASKGGVGVSASNKVVKIDLDNEWQRVFAMMETPNEQRQLAFDYIRDNLRGKCPTSDGQSVIINGTTAKKYVKNAPEVKLRVVPQLAEMLEQGELVNIVQSPQHNKFSQFAYYKTIFKINDKEYVGVLNIGIMKDGTATLYDMNPYNEK